MKRLGVFFGMLLFGAVHAFAAKETSLSGQWRFQLDRNDAGVKERWFERVLPDRINLPGTLAAQGIGDDVTTNTSWTGTIVDHSWFTAPEYAKYRQPGNAKVPFWLTPDKYYAGAAWYQRDIEVLKSWTGQHVILLLERPHWETRVWIDDKFIGTNNSLATPHEFDLGELSPGKHTLSIRVDNRQVVRIGENSHSISDHTQGNWNGIVGRIGLYPRPAVWIDRLEVFPEIAKKTVRVRISMGNSTGKEIQAQLRWTIWDVTHSRYKQWSDRFREKVVTISGTRATDEVTCDIPSGVGLWDEFTPNLHMAEVHLTPLNHSVYVDGLKTTHVPMEVAIFGLREISADGTQFLLNGKKVFIRGTLDCGSYPLTGHPPMDVEGWKRVIRAAKAHGLNEIRFHSWCPPEAAFTAADELGFYFHVEASSWANDHVTWLGDGQPVDAWIYAETDRILEYYGNHPSFLLMVYGNEPGGKNHEDYLAKYVSHYRSRDGRRFWSSGAGWPELPQNQWHNIPEPRIQGWGEGLKSRINGRAPETATDYRANISRRAVPVVSHEIGQWCVYPNFDEMKKYTGYLKPKNFEIFRDFLGDHGLDDLARQFFLASGKLQAICYKEEIESALRTPGMGGFELLDLHDFPGQGTALIGVLDPFWEEKGYVTPKEFRRFCNHTVPLARLKKRVFSTDEQLEAEIEVAHFGPAPLENVTATWKLISETSLTLASGKLPARTLPTGNGIAVGRVTIDLKAIPAPARYKLVVGLSEMEAVAPRVRSELELARLRTRFEDDWDVWVYPTRAASDPGKDVLVTAQFDDAARGHLRRGGKLLLTIPGRQVRNFDTAPVKFGFSTIFWNTAWTQRQAPTTMGILCDPKHPALAEFPTEFYSNWQWWYLAHRAGALRLDLLPDGLKPIVRVVDDWFTARPLGLVVEGKVGAGRIVVCGFDLMRDSEDPVSQQMRSSLLRYINSKHFRPATDISPEQIASLIALPKETRLPGVRSIKADSQEEGNEAANAVDGDPETIWHTPWSGVTTGFPHELTVELVESRAIGGVKLLPRQDGNQNGWIAECELYVSADGNSWGQPVARTKLPATRNEQEVKFDKAVTTRFVKLRALSGHADGPWASLAEIGFMPGQ